MTLKFHDIVLENVTVVQVVEAIMTCDVSKLVTVVFSAANYSPEIWGNE